MQSFAFRRIFSIFAYSILQIIKIYINQRLKKEERFYGKQENAEKGYSSDLWGSFAEAIALSLYGAEAQQESANALLFSIVKLEDEYICRISHPEPGMKANDYFKKLREQFGAQVNDIIDQMNG